MTPMTPDQRDLILRLATELLGQPMTSFAEINLHRSSVFGYERTIWTDKHIDGEDLAEAKADDIIRTLHHELAVERSGVRMHDHVVFDLDGIAPAAVGGSLAYAPDGADAASYSAPHVRGTVVDDHRDLNPDTGELEGAVTIRIDHTVTWQGDRTGNHPRDFGKGNFVHAWPTAYPGKVVRDDLCTAGAEFRDAQIAAANIMTGPRERLDKAIAAARAEGLSEPQIAARAHTTRTTVRDRQGKSRSKTLDLAEKMHPDQLTNHPTTWTLRTRDESPPDAGPATRMGGVQDLPGRAGSRG